MDFIDHDLLYSDEAGYAEWNKLVHQSKSSNAFWRRYARKKMRRCIRELLSGIRPRLRCID